MSAKAILSASVSAPPAVYVEDVFSTFLYTGNGGTQTITNGIALANGFSITPGTALAGGFFAGFISHTDDGVATHALIVAPAATGATGTGYTLTTMKQWKTANTTTAGTTSSFDGAANSANMNNADHPAAQFCEGLSIGGYSDWYLPARYELDIAYENLKPTTTSNNTSFGINPYSVPERTVNRTAGAPAQTSVAAFKTGGAEAFIADNHWSSTENSSTLAWMRNFGDGDEFNGSKTDTRHVRAFRKIPINDPLITAYAVTGEGGLVWTKGRNTNWHYLIDNERGTGKILYSNLTDAQENFLAGSLTYSSTGYALSGTAFGSNGDINSNGVNYCSWTFRKAPKFFDVVTYTGNGAASQTIAHSLGSVPGCMIMKGTSAATNWPVYHRSMDASPQNFYMILDGTTAKTSAVANWGNTSPTSTQFTVGGNNNANGITYVAYLWAHDAGGFGDAGTDNVVSCGSFTTDGSGNFTDQNIGYEPQWLMLKSSNTADPWIILDSMRGLNLTQYAQLFANTSGAENAGNSAYVYPTSTGFGGSNSNLDASATYIYIAIRRGPMKTPTVGTEVFALNEGTGSTSGQSVTTNFPVDMDMTSNRTLGGVATVGDRVRGYGNTDTAGATPTLTTSSTSAESTASNPYFYKAWNTTITRGSNGADPGGGKISYYFRRAPGFFDVVAYTGNGSTQTIAHNLGVVPELIIAKNRTVAGNNWPVLFNYASTTMNYGFLNLTNSGPNDTYANVGVFSAAPTATSMFLVNSGSMNASGSGIIAYLFATLTGVSKVGGYTGTGSGYTVDVNCGFTTGARFVLIKRTDSTGDWFVWDTARGIISGNDPYLLFNSTAAEVTNTDYIDPLSTGFQISSTAPAAINANGGTYIFLAIS